MEFFDYVYVCYCMVLCLVVGFFPTVVPVDATIEQIVILSNYNTCSTGEIETRLPRLFVRFA